MAYLLQKPHSNKQRADFVCQHQGLVSVENDFALYFLENNEVWNQELNQPEVNPNYLTQSLSLAKKQKSELNLSNCYKYLDNAFIVYNNVQFEVSTDANTRLSTALTLLQLGITDTIDWVSKDDIKIPLNANDILSILALGADFVTNVWNNVYLDFKSQIDNASSIQELDNISLIYGA